MAGSSAPHSCLLSSCPLSHPCLPSGMGKRTIRAKTRKLVGWDNDSLTGRTNLAMQAKQRRNSFTSSQGQAGVQLFPGKLGSFTDYSYLERAALLLQMSPFHPSPQLLLLSIRSCSGIFLWSVRVSCCSVSPPSVLCTCSLFAGGAGWETKKALSLCQCYSATAKRCLCYQQFSLEMQNIVPSRLLWGKLGSFPAIPNVSM